MRAWTVLVYMAATAGDLTEPAARDLQAIEAARADALVEVSALDPREVRRLQLFRAKETGAETVEVVDEEGVSLEESVRRFVSWGVERSPADHYAVIVWGHGLGWRPAPAGAEGIAFDERRGAALDAPALARALTRASRERLGGRPFDVYASDACLMQSVEVAGELGVAARYVVGSEQIEEDYLGLPYRAWLPVLDGSAPMPPAPACPPADEACLAAAALPTLQDAGAAERFTLSAVDEAALSQALLPSLRRVATAVEAYAREGDLRRIGLAVLLRGTPGFRGGTRDVRVFLDRLADQVQREPGAAGTAGQQAVLDAVAAAREALERTVIAASFGPRYRRADFAAMAGLSLWLPHDGEELRARGDSFASTALWHGPSDEASFRAWLDLIFAAPRQ